MKLYVAQVSGRQPADGGGGQRAGSAAGAAHAAPSAQPAARTARRCAGAPRAAAVPVSTSPANLRSPAARYSARASRRAS